MKRLRLLLMTTVYTALIALSPRGSPRADQGGEQPRPTGYALRSLVIGGAGSSGSAGGLRSSGTLGQPSPIGVGTAGDLTLSGGFWQGFLELASAVTPLSPHVIRTELYPSQPNPTSRQTVIAYAIAKAGPVEIAVYDVMGRRARLLVAGHTAPGQHSLIWDARDDAGRLLPSGVYVCRLQTQSETRLRKMLVVN